MNFLEFIFQDFWHFIGMLILVSVILEGLGGIFNRK